MKQAAGSSIALLLLCSALACAPAQNAPEQDSKLEEQLEALEFTDLAPRDLGSSARKTSLKDLPIPKWPGSWHLADRGRFGTAELPVVWFKLDAGQTPVSEAAQAAALAVTEVAGRIALEDIAYLADPERAVAQVRGSRVNAAIEASRTQERTLVKITLEAKPGFGRAR